MILSQPDTQPDETLIAISHYYYWPNMTKQIKIHVRHCLICASSKRGGALQQAAPLCPHPPARPWQVISLVIMGPYPESRMGNRFLIVATDIYSKWIEAKAVAQARAKEITNFLQQVCQRWGYPEETITDSATSFRGALWNRFHRRHNIRTYVTPIYHQRANPVERRNQEIKKLFRIHLQEKQDNQWDEALGDILFTLRNRVNAASGITPSEALLGAPLVRPGEWQHPEVKRAVDNSAAARDQRIDRVRTRQSIYARNLFPFPREAPRHFNVGDQVLVRVFSGTQTPFGTPWTGPHPIVAVQGDNTYKINRNGAQYLVHVDDIRSLPQSQEAEESQQQDDNNPPLRSPIKPLPGPSTGSPDLDEFHAAVPSIAVSPPCQRKVQATILGQAVSSPHQRDAQAIIPDHPPTREDAETAVPEYPAFSPRQVNDRTHYVLVEDLSDDLGDPEEASPVPGLVPVIGLYP